MEITQLTELTWRPGLSSQQAPGRGSGSQLNATGFYKILGCYTQRSTSHFCVKNNALQAKQHITDLWNNLYFLQASLCMALVLSSSVHGDMIQRGISSFIFGNLKLGLGDGRAQSFVKWTLKHNPWPTRTITWITKVLYGTNFSPENFLPVQDSVIWLY